MKAILIDDELHNLSNLQALLERYCPTVEVCALAQNADQARTAIYTHQPDLLFLDIQMPGEDGFSLLKRLTNPDVEVIFVTAYDQYAIQAMRFAAVDYLLKPVDISELQAAVARATKQRQLKNQQQQVDFLLQWMEAQARQEAPKLALSTLEETRFVAISAIIRCVSSNNYTTFYLNDGTTLLVSKPIYEYDDLLRSYGFIRCHQSHLVNKAYIKSWKKTEGDLLLLRNGDEVPIARSKKELVKQALQR